MRMTERELINGMKDMTHEERIVNVQLAVFWVCNVIMECKMNTEDDSIQSLLDVLFDLKNDIMED